MRPLDELRFVERAAVLKQGARAGRLERRRNAIMFAYDEDHLGSGGPPVAALTLLRQFSFAYLTCNGDAHAKNFSVRRDGGEWRPTPIYDVPTSYVYGNHTMALDVQGKRREDIGRGDFVALGEAVGVRSPAVERALDELCERVDSWIDDVAGGLPFDPGVLEKLRRAIEYRRERLR